jgi:pimeloyl-ACP methyl ester carboxylesterase
VLAVGYSMGGPIAALLAREHPDLVAGLVLCATAPDWQEPRMKLLWRRMSGLRVILGVFPNAAWRRGLRAAGFPDSPVTTWFASELTRGSARDVAEAGKELGRYDARPWIGGVATPAAVVVTTRDRGVPPRKQRELAAALDATTVEVAGDHAAVTAQAEEFNAALLAALDAVRARAAGPSAGTTAAAVSAS